MIYLSFIIPFYGTADAALLQCCTDSIRSQGLEEGEDYEIIIATEGNRGLGGARNSGMRQARGKYIVFVDADDYLLPHALPQCLSTLKEHEPLDMLRFDFVKCFAAGVGEARRHQCTGVVKHQSYDTGADYMYTHNFYGVVWRYFFRREFLVEYRIRFSEDRYHEDEAFLCICYFYAGRTVVTDFPMYTYVLHPASITLNDNRNECTKRINDFKQELLQLHHFAMQRQAGVSKQRNEASALQQKALTRRIAHLTIDFIRRMRRDHCPLKVAHCHLRELKTAGLLPLPGETYSWKYRLVRPVINSYISLFIV